MVEIVKLPNGIHLLIDTIKKTHKVAVACCFNVGSQDEPAHLNGITHFLEHALFLGSEKYDENAIRTKEYMFGSELNGETRRSDMILSASVLKDDFEEAYNILADLIRHPVFPKDLLERERNIIISEINETDLSYEMDDLMYASAYPQHSMGLPIIGTIQSVRQMTRQDIIDYYQKHYHPENLVISFVGDITPQECVRATRLLFENWQTTDIKPKKVSVPYVGGDKRKTSEEDVVTFRLGFNGIPAARVQEYMAAQIFAKVLSEKLYNKLRTEKGLVYSVPVENDAEKESAVFYVETTCEKRKANIIIPEICRIIKETTQKIDEDIFHYAKKKLKLSLMEEVAYDEQAESNYYSFKHYGRVLTLKDYCCIIDAIGLKDIYPIAQKITSSRLIFSGLGKNNVPGYQQIASWLQNEPAKPHKLLSHAPINNIENLKTRQRTG